MIIEEYPYGSNERFVRHASDSGKMILQIETNILYNEAIDIYPCRYSYMETDIPVEITDIPDESGYVFTWGNLGE